jgi:hypothetical protein
MFLRRSHSFATCFFGYLVAPKKILLFYQAARFARGLYCRAGGFCSVLEWCRGGEDMEVGTNKTHKGKCGLFSFLGSSIPRNISTLIGAFWPL